MQTMAVLNNFLINKISDAIYANFWCSRKHFLNKKSVINETINQFLRFLFLIKP